MKEKIIKKTTLICPQCYSNNIEYLKKMNYYICANSCCDLQIFKKPEKTEIYISK